MLEAVLRSRLTLKRSTFTLKDIDNVLNAIVECVGGCDMVTTMMCNISLPVHGPPLPP